MEIGEYIKHHKGTVSQFRMQETRQQKTYPLQQINGVKKKTIKIKQKEEETATDERE